MHYSDKHNVLQMPRPNDTIGKFFLLGVFMYICLPQSKTDVMKFTAALSHRGMHMIDICPYKMF